MKRDARTLPDATTLEADLCIVGAGPAGIALARELIGSNVQVVLLESGGLRRDAACQQLNDGIVIGDPYIPLRRTRHRGAGGTAQLWNTPVGGGQGAKYAPLDACDFEPREDLPLSGWPFPRSELEPFYRRAQAVCGLGPFEYGGSHWAGEGHRPLALGEPLSTAVYQFGSGNLFTGAYIDDICASPEVTLVHGASACGLETAAGGAGVTAVLAATLSGTRLRVAAGRTVLASGAVENARLLLWAAPGSSTPGASSDWIGRCLMEHPRDSSLTLVPRSPEFAAQAAFYDAHAAPDGTIICGRIALDPDTLRAGSLPNASVTLLPERQAPRHPLARLILRRVRAAAGLPPWTEGYGWSQHLTRPRVPQRFRLLVNVEQRPSRDNRIALSRGRDRLGMPRVEMHWRLGTEERATLARLRATIAGALEASGVGTVVVDPRALPDPNAHHHAGTTRMHRDERLGVVDADLKVHGTDNLYVAGASAFPTAGFANPTLTVVALSLRLADHLRHAIRGSGRDPASTPAAAASTLRPPAPR